MAGVRAREGVCWGEGIRWMVLGLDEGLEFWRESAEIWGWKRFLGVGNVR